MVTVTTLPSSPRGERGPHETAAIAIKTSHNEIFFMSLFVQCKINNLWNLRVKRFRDETVQQYVINAPGIRLTMPPVQKKQRQVVHLSLYIDPESCNQSVNAPLWSEPIKSRKPKISKSSLKYAGFPSPPWLLS